MDNPIDNSFFITSEENIMQLKILLIEFILSKFINFINN